MRIIEQHLPFNLRPPIKKLQLNKREIATLRKAMEICEKATGLWLEVNCSDIDPHLRSDYSHEFELAMAESYLYEYLGNL